MHEQHLCVCWRPLGALALMIVAGAASADDPPDAVALLKNAGQARSSITSGKLDVALTTRMFSPREQTDLASLTVAFDGQRRTFRQRSRELRIDGSGPDGGRSKLDRLAAMNNDREAFVKAGLGTWEEIEITSAWDGTDFCQYRRMDGASYRAHDKGTAEFVFDPRRLGILEHFTMTRTLGDCLPLEKATLVRLVGKEAVLNRPAWHVQVDSGSGVKRHFWVESTEPFRIRKFVYEDPRGNRIVQLSDYDEGNPASILPRRVTSRRYTKDDKLRNETVMEVTKAQFGVPIDPQIGKIGSLGIAIGEPIVDERIGRRIGHWNGSGVTPERNADK